MGGQNVWEETLGFIEARLGKDVVDTWFEPVRFGEIQGSTVTILVPNKFFGEWFSRNYREVLGEAFQSIAGVGERELDVMFVVDETSGKAPTNVRKADESDQEALRGRTRRRPLFNPKYTFDNFVVGASNQFAHAASLAVAEAPGRAYNPFFIYGGVGLGKTHLLNSIGNFAARNGDLRIAYVTTEQFTNEVINSIRYDKMIELRKRYRSVDMLLIDDIQFLAGKERTQEEFFHTFNTLYEAHKQIVLSSDRFPKDMPSMEERLRSRFEWGLIADLQQPDVETRIAILRKKSDEEGIIIGDDVLHQLAHGLNNNIRELEGALIRLGAYASLIGKTITVDMAKHVLVDLLGSQKKVITTQDVQDSVAKKYHVKVSELKSKRRTKTLIQPRQIAMFLCRELTNSSFPEIGREFGGKDHTTIMHACKQIEKSLESNHSLRAAIESLKDEIGKV